MERSYSRRRFDHPADCSDESSRIAGLSYFIELRRRRPAFASSRQLRFLVGSASMR